LGAIALWAMLPGPAAVAAEVPSVERGRLLYENHCIVCHTPNVHRRPQRLAMSEGELRELVTHWARQENLRWSAEDVEDVVQFLRVTRYNY
jgi:mono/diheme cytochrome c family protein